MENQGINFLFLLLLVCIVLCGAHLLVYYTFFYKISNRYVSYLVFFLLFCNLLYFLHHYFTLPYLLEMLFSISLGISFFLFAGAVFYYLCLSPFLLFASKEQCIFAIPYLKSFSLLLVVGSIIASLYNGIQKPVVKEVSITLPNLKQQFTLAQISDLHINLLTNPKNLEAIIIKINQLQPDAIVLTGDIVDAKLSEVSEKLHLLSKLKAKHGIYYVLGNHEYYHDTYNILEAIKNLGMIVLNNTSTTININSKPLLNIIGITDLSGNQLGFLQPNLTQAILKGNPNIPSILLSHQPKVIEYLKNTKEKKVDLILSGHTHGGQIFPFNFLVKIDQPYIKGLHAYQQNSLIYINQGTSTWGPPMRLGTQSEITFITLKNQE